ncbi:hypothetical protein GS399_10825 [Pedobacter sp. HMF7647]|uniref:Lipoprotein n=1 Tax=Hufsiella arboris TaxID=2695275 RepID=A0A7K1YA61_9SPHI|nr:hypothetical protein [Hufsiella arboris]MXV51464.1 hypothetical protein [Hufsiella arboris]
MIKNYFKIICALVLGLSACHKNDVSIKVSDNGKTMRIQARKDTIDYDREFDVQRMSNSQKNKLKAHVLDSLGFNGK